MNSEKSYISILKLLFRLTCTFLLLTPILSNEIENQKKQVLYGGITDFIIYFGLLFLFLFVIICDIIAFVKSKKIVSFIPSFSGIVLIIFSFLVYTNYHKRIKEKTLYKAYYQWNHPPSGEYGYIIEFKKSGRYVVFENESDEPVSYNYYGNYEKNDSLFILDKNIGKMGISKFLKIIDTPNDSPIFERIKKKLVPVYKNGNKFSDGVSFRLKINNKKQ